MFFFQLSISTLMILSAINVDCHYLNLSKSVNEDVDDESYYPPAEVDEYRNLFLYLPEYNDERETSGNDHERMHRDLPRVSN